MITKDRRRSVNVIDIKPAGRGGTIDSLEEHRSADLIESSQADQANVRYESRMREAWAQKRAMVNARTLAQNYLKKKQGAPDFSKVQLKPMVKKDVLLREAIDRELDKLPRRSK